MIPRAVEKYKEMIDDLPNAAKGYIPPIRDKINKIMGR